MNRWWFRVRASSHSCGACVSALRCRNPRKNQRIKYESALKRRKGQVVAMRVGEADRYIGETTGIRTTVSRSHKIA